MAGSVESDNDCLQHQEHTKARIGGHLPQAAAARELRWPTQAKGKPKMRRDPIGGAV